MALLVAGCTSASGHRPVDLKRLTVEAFVGAGSAAETRQLLLAQGRITEAAIASCMKRRGFAYVPNPASYVPADDSAAAVSDFTSLTYAERHGFGLTDPYLDPPPRPPSDPNAAAFDALSTSDKVAYSEALDGADGGAGSSCRSDGEKAFAEQSGGASFAARLQDLAEQVTAQPAVVTAREAWQRCAANAEYEFPSRRELIRSINDRIDKARGATPRDVGQPLATDERSALDDIRQYEVGAATATFDCSQRYDTVFVDALREASGVR